MPAGIVSPDHTRALQILSRLQSGTRRRLKYHLRVLALPSWRLSRPQEEQCAKSRSRGQRRGPQRFGTKMFGKQTDGKRRDGSRRACRATTRQPAARTHAA